MGLRYGFIGLGSMGYPMCINIHSKIPSDSHLFICDVKPSVLDRFVQETTGKAKVKPLKTPKEIAEHSDVIITMLPQGRHVQQVYYHGDDSLISANPAIAFSQGRKLFIDCSTIDADISREVGEKVQSSRLGDFSDAAVSGGPQGAKAATLTHMIGCDPAILEKVKSVVSMTGKSLFHCGPIGTGVTVKVINNYIAMCSMLSASEGINMGIKMGIDPKKLSDIINVSSGQTWIMEKTNPCPGVMADGVASNGYKPGFAIELASGTVDLAVARAGKVGAKLALGKSLQDAYHAACEDARCKGLDSRSIYKWVAEID